MNYTWDVSYLGSIVMNLLEMLVMVAPKLVMVATKFDQVGPKFSQVGPKLVTYAS
jgi:hypothetical protein